MYLRIKHSIVGIFNLFMILAPLSFAQVYELSRYADDNGLPSRIIRGTFQDKEGFLWIAGHNGLFRFDTKEFKSYYAPLKDTTGLRGNKINSIIQSSDGKIWVGVEEGLHFIENDIVSYKKLEEN